MKKWLTPQQALDTYFTGPDGKHLFSLGTLLNMCRTGQIQATRLGMKRRYFISADVCEHLGQEHIKGDNIQ